MPMRINGLWRVSWWQPSNGIVKVMLDLDGGPEPHYFVGNYPREFGEPKLKEMYRLIIQPAFPHEVNDS